MANFSKIPGSERLSGETLVVTENSIRIGLFGFRDFSGAALTVVANSPGVTCTAGAITGVNQEWTISTLVSGTVRLEARTATGAMWDWMEIRFEPASALIGSGLPDTEADRTAVLDAIKSGRIVGAAEQLRTVAEGKFVNAANGQMTLGPGMFATLAALSNVGQVSILSLMRFGQGPHGKRVAADLAVCSAVDIQMFKGIPINLLRGENVDNAIAGVAAVIANLPRGEFAFGLPRPSPIGKGPPMPDRDVFLPCDPAKGWPMYRVGYPLHDPTPSFRNADAATAVRNAITQNSRARVNRMFEDGPDHMHLEVISASSGA